MNNFDHLKKVKPKRVKAPDVREDDIPWSEVFLRAAESFENRTASYGLCNEVQEVCPTFQQGSRMRNYIANLMTKSDIYVAHWLERHNPGVRANLFDYRAAWARHLSQQFLDKGL